MDVGLTLKKRPPSENIRDATDKNKCRAVGDVSRFQCDKKMDNRTPSEVRFKGNHEHGHYHAGQANGIPGGSMTRFSLTSESLTAETSPCFHLTPPMNGHATRFISSTSSPECVDTTDHQCVATTLTSNGNNPLDRRQRKQFATLCKSPSSPQSRTCTDSPPLPPPPPPPISIRSDSSEVLHREIGKRLSERDSCSPLQRSVSMNKRNERAQQHCCHQETSLSGSLCAPCHNQQSHSAPTSPGAENNDVLPSYQDTAVQSGPGKPAGSSSSRRPSKSPPRQHLGVKDYGERLAPVIKQSFSSYCQETTLHGWKYVTSNSSTFCEKTTWLVLLVVSLSTASVLVYRAVGDFMSHTVSTNMESLSTKFTNIYFPAITICNMNSMQRSVLQKYGIEDSDVGIEVFDRMVNVGTEQEFTGEELRMYEEIERKANGSKRLKLEGNPKCSTMFLALTWKNRAVPVNSEYKAMHYQQTTDESVCCQIFPGMLQAENNHAFNISNGTFWTKEPNPWQIIFDGYKPGIKPGKQGVQVLIDVETYEYFSVHSSGSEGVLVLVQHYRDIPLMRKESFVLAPGFEVDVGLSITEITTTPGAIERFTPEERDCYTADEVNLVSLPLKKGYRMSMNNCLYDKALHATKEECGCVPPFYTIGAMGELPVCKGTRLFCAYQIFDDVVQARPVGTAKTCRAPCNDQIYDSRIAFASYPNRALFSKRPEMCPLVIKLIKICSGWMNEKAVPYYGQYPDEYRIKKSVLLAHFPLMCDLLSNFSLSDNCTSIRRAISISPDLEQTLYKYAKDNLLWLNVYVKDSFSTNIVRDEKMTRTSFVANVGGLLGLCMGFSLVSVAEILYYMFKRQTLVACQRGVVARQQRRAASRKKMRRNAAAASLRRMTREAANYTTRDSGESSQGGSRKTRKRKRKKHQEDVSFGTTDEVSEMLQSRTATEAK